MSRTLIPHDGTARSHGATGLPSCALRLTLRDGWGQTLNVKGLECPSLPPSTQHQGALRGSYRPKTPIGSRRMENMGGTPPSQRPGLVCPLL
jgi:hypothetical protein